jgi:hypothetical protein
LYAYFHAADFAVATALSGFGVSSTLAGLFASWSLFFYGHFEGWTMDEEG